MTKNSIKNKKIGLALGGGATLGAAHIGVLKALNELNVPIHYISGTSIGALVAAFYCFDKDYNCIQDIAINMSWKDVASVSISKYGLFTNIKIENFLKNHIGTVTFKEGKIPMAFVATNILNGKKVILNKGDVAKSVAASCCIPGIFKPVEVGSRLLVDGGLVENVPISPLKKMGADFIIGVDLNSGSSYKKPNNFMDILVNSYQTSMVSKTKIQTRNIDVLVAPKLSDFSAVNTNKTKDLIEIGYQTGLESIQNLLNTQ